MNDFASLLQQGNAWLFVPSAILLGALHGLEPGHSKTMMAAFIVAIRGTLKQAVLLGLAATLSHTAVVWIIAMAGLWFGRGWDAHTSEPWFQLISGVLIVAIALWMAWRTWKESQPHDHHHDHDHECGCGCGHHHHDHEGHHHADDVFTSWGKETIRTYTKEEIGNILKTLEEDGSYGNILRAKGMVAGADGEWIYFDMVPGEHEVRTGAPEYTGRICVIGAEIKEDKLAELFQVK